MPFLDKHTIATKVIGVSKFQHILVRMREEPGSVTMIEVDNVGRVFIHFEDRTVCHAGYLQDKYWKHFGHLFVKERTLTGGRPIEGRGRIGFQGMIAQPVTWLGLNLVMEIEKNER